MGTLVSCVLAACACPFGFSFGIQDARGDFFKPLYKSLASVVAVLAFVEAAISIVSSVMCCNAICRIKPAMTPISVQTAGNQTVTYQANNPATFPPGLLTAPSYPGFNRASKPIQYNRKAAKGLGSIQMTIGIICILMNIILLAVNSEPNYFTQISQIGYGIWGGIVFLIAGYLQVLSGRKIQNKHLIIAAMVMCIIAACVTAAIILFGILEALTNAKPTQPYELVHIAKTHIALGSFMAILAFVEAVISITGAAFCCGTVCWNSSDMADVPIHAAGNQTVMYQANNPVVFPLGPSPEKPSAQQVEYHPSPQIPMNSGLISNHPPPYS